MFEHSPAYKAAQEQADQYRNQTETIQDHWNKVNRFYEEHSQKINIDSQAQQNLTDSASKAAAALYGISGGTGGMLSGGRAGIQDWLGNQNTYFEYDSEGHASQYGPEGNRLGDEFGIGLSRRYKRLAIL